MGDGPEERASRRVAKPGVAVLGPDGLPAARVTAIRAGARARVAAHVVGSGYSSEGTSVDARSCQPVARCNDYLWSDPSPRGTGRLLGRGVEPVEQIGRGDP
jgi:hypothetical protein